MLDLGKQTLVGVCGIDEGVVGNRVVAQYQNALGIGVRKRCGQRKRARLVRGIRMLGSDEKFAKTVYGFGKQIGVFGGDHDLGVRNADVIGIVVKVIGRLDGFHTGGKTDQDLFGIRRVLVFEIVILHRKIDAGGTAHAADQFGHGGVGGFVCVFGGENGKGGVAVCFYDRDGRRGVSKVIRYVKIADAAVCLFALHVRLHEIADRLGEHHVVLCGDQQVVFIKSDKERGCGGGRVKSKPHAQAGCRRIGVFGKVAARFLFHGGKQCRNVLGAVAVRIQTVIEATVQDQGAIAREQIARVCEKARKRVAKQGEERRLHPTAGSQQQAQRDQNTYQ